MKLSVGQNIRSYRKALGLTQEQLAEAMGVTVGAVSKWESDLSRPDLELLVELADFFEISVDVLLGYDWRSLSCGQMAERIRRLYQNKKYDEGVREADKALQKYPNCFDIIYQSAVLYNMKGFEQKDKKTLRKSLELYQHSLNFLQQNTDEEIGEISIQRRMGEIYMALGDPDTAISLLKKFNQGDINSASIGLILAYGKKNEEALPYLSNSLLNNIAELLSNVIGFVHCFEQKKDYASALVIIDWMRTIVKGLMIPEKENYANKMDIILLTTIALIQSDLKNCGSAKDALKQARDAAILFDANPDFNAGSIRFYHGKNYSLYDDFGETAMQGIERSIIENKDESLLHVWKELKNNC